MLVPCQLYYSGEIRCFGIQNNVILWSIPNLYILKCVVKEKLLSQTTRGIYTHRTAKRKLTGTVDS